MKDKIRIARASDIPALVRLNGLLQELHSELHPADFKPILDEEGAVRFFEGLILREQHALGILDGPTGAAGYIWLEFIERPETLFQYAARVLYIHHIVVEPAVRGKGGGSILMAWASAEAGRRGATHIRVEHWAGNSGAHHFFSRSGFEEVKVTLGRTVASEG
jgi:diamine N-acetyltransferase